MDYKDISVIKHGAGQGMDITFLNGKVSIPDEYGGYTISCGCGGGKTTAITQIIWQNSDQGVVYLVDTCAELEKMYNSLLKLIAKYPMAGLTKDDIFCIRGNRNEKDGDDDTYNKQLKVFKNDVSILHRKKVLLLTHVRFFSALTPDFLMYSSDPDAKLEFDGNYGNLMKSDNIRKYILIDETPNQWQSVAKIPRLMLRAMTNDPIKPGTKRPFRPDMRAVYEECCEGTEYDILKGYNQFLKQRKETILKTIPIELANWEDSKDQVFRLYFMPSHLIQANMKCHVLLFEGVGDVLLKDSRKFKLIQTAGQKYNATVKCDTFKLSRERKQKYTPDAVDQYVSDLSTVLDKFNKKDKTLVICWKDITGMKDDRTGESKFVDAIQAEIDKKYKNVKVIYHGSSSTKSTNEFKDYNNVVFLGEWSVGNNDIAITRNAYSIDLTNDRWQFYYYVQAICRIGIRKHKGGKFNICFSDDHNPAFVDMVRRYFNNNDPYVKPQKKDIDPLIRIAELLDDRYKKSFWNLTKYDKDVEKSLKDGEQYNITIPIDDLAKIQEERKEKNPKPSRFKPFANAMAGLGIHISVINRRGIVKDLR